MGLKRFNNNNNKKNNNNNNKSSVVSIRAGKKKSSSSSFEQLPELTEDETAKKWAGESNDSPTIVSKKESGRGDATNPTTSSTRKLRKKEDAIEQDVLEGEACLLGDGIWEKLCEEAKMEIELEPALASYLYSTILSHKEMSDALAFVLANTADMRVWARSRAASIKPLDFKSLRLHPISSRGMVTAAKRVPAGESSRVKLVRAAQKVGGTR